MEIYFTNQIYLYNVCLPRKQNEITIQQILIKKTVVFVEKNEFSNFILMLRGQVCCNKWNSCNILHVFCFGL